MTALACTSFTPPSRLCAMAVRQHLPAMSPMAPGTSRIDVRRGRRYAAHCPRGPGCEPGPNPAMRDAGPHGDQHVGRQQGFGGGILDTHRVARPFKPRTAVQVGPRPSSPTRGCRFGVWVGRMRSCASTTTSTANLRRSKRLSRPHHQLRGMGVGDEPRWMTPR